jgi:hypothetical protein
MATEVEREKACIEGFLHFMQHNAVFIFQVQCMGSSGDSVEFMNRWNLSILLALRFI